MGDGGKMRKIIRHIATDDLPSFITSEEDFYNAPAREEKTEAYLSFGFIRVSFTNQ